MTKKKAPTKRKYTRRKPRAIVIAPKAVQLNQNQELEIIKDTPERFIKQRPGRGGKKFNYVEVGYVIDRLNKIFGKLGWDRETGLVPELTDENFITVKVKLTVKDHKGHSVTKTSFGGVDRKRLTKDKGYVDPGDDAKAAEADGLKKAASLFGIAFDVYYPNMAAQKKIIEGEFEEAKTPRKNEVHYCSRCERDNKKTKITPAEADYSTKQYGYKLCRACQKAAEDYVNNQNQDKKLYSEMLKTIRSTKDKKGLANLKKNLAKNKTLTDQQREFVRDQIEERLKEI